ncbi:MAG: dUTP diphosphatase, partial [Clostridia bacterium]|nr:dUTP diphosphatase [Clostridia bacterium]
MILKIKKLSENAIIPEKAHKTDAGYDLFSAVEDTLNPGEYKKIPVGIAIQLPPNTEAQIRPRSGLAANYGITLLNT